MRDESRVRMCVTRGRLRAPNYMLLLLLLSTVATTHALLNGGKKPFCIPYCCAGHRAAATRCVLHRPYSWNELQTHAIYQSARYQAGEYPGRSPEGNAQYDQYKRWCVEHGGMTNADYVLKYVQWHKGSALEPSLAPYLLEEGIEHWILWHHPSKTPGDTELERDDDARIAMAHVAASSGRAHLDHAHLICFQNVVPLRSIPTIAHSHVFLYVAAMPHATRQAIEVMRRAWRSRSPWLQQAEAPEAVEARTSSDTDTTACRNS